MSAAIEEGVGDLDGKAASEEFRMLADWAKANTRRLSPKARKVMSIYEKYAQAARAHGQSCIAYADCQRMLREMRQMLRPRMSAFSALSIIG